MAKVNINSQSYEVHEEVAEQFSKFIRKSNDSRLEIAALKKQVNSAVEAVHESEFEDIGYNVLCALGQNP
jgi:copper oxidase (laccase) domain-containing protein